MLNLRNKAIALTAALVILSSSAAAKDQVSFDAGLMRQVRKELVTLPYYGVFDNLAFEINGKTVTLYGQVLRPTTRKDAERRVAKIEGVERVINKIEVLPLSGFDDSIRLRTYRAVFKTGGLYRYALGANPSIHIIVKGGNVTLEGVVSSEMDSRLAYLAASGVPGAFSVINNLRVERAS
jgi:hyperosmotically inducible protein